jgi:glycosyltransferase involved in cell wall biosynthesis
VSRRTVRLYGFTRGWGSYRQVTNGFWDALIAHGWVSGESIALQPLDGLGLDDEDEPQVPLSTADVGILTGPPSLWPLMHQGARHAERSVMVAPNSDALPPKLMRELSKAATVLLTPSEWARKVVQLYSELPVRVVRHGLSSQFNDSHRRRYTIMLEDSYQNESFEVLHLTSTAAERKGTVSLMRAWHELLCRGALPSKAMLSIVAPLEMVSNFFATGLVDGKRVNVVDRIDGSPDAMANVYASKHLLCQPSRGEAFGMTPLEARACGCPVVATRCTGHEEHLSGIGEEHGVVIVPHGPNAAIDDLPGARAPSVEVDAIVVALERAYRSWKSLNTAAFECAPVVSNEWSWKKQLEGFAEEL